MILLLLSRKALLALLLLDLEVNLFLAFLFVHYVRLLLLFLLLALFALASLETPSEMLLILFL